MQKNTKFRTHLLYSAGAAALMMGASAAHAETIIVTDTGYAIGQNQAVAGVSPAVGAEITVGASVVTSGTVTDSSVIVSDEAYSTSATGNTASSTLTSTVNNDTIGADLASVESSFAATIGAEATAADASLAVTAAQDVVGVVGTSSQNASIGIDSGVTQRSTLTTADNVQESRGVLNVQDSTINLSANSTNTSAGIASAQSVENSSMASSANSTVSINVAGGNIENSTASLTGNDQVAVAVGNSGANLISGTVNSAVALGAASLEGATATPGTDTAAAVAGFSVSSNQTVDDDLGSVISAVVGSQAADGFQVTIANTVLSSTVANDSNSALASVRGNENTNRISLSGNSLVTVDATAVGDPQAVGTLAAVANTQSFAGVATATTLAGAAAALRTQVGTDVESSTVSTSSNLIDAAATGNRGANAIVLDASTIETGAVLAAASTNTGVASIADANGGAALASSQSMTGSVGASLSLLASGEGTSGAEISVDVGNDVDSSTVRADSNRLQATAIGNQITANTNSISVTGNTVNTSTALANLQSLDGSVTADIGSAGTDLVPSSSFAFAGATIPTGSSITIAAPVGVTSTNAESIRAALDALSGVLTVTYSSVTNLFTLTNTDPAGLNLAATSVAFGGTAATPASGGVTVAVGNDILDSTVSVNGNAVAGSVTGNTANNVISVAATNLNLDGTLPRTSDAAVLDESAGSASADNALANEQAIADLSTLDTTVNSRFAIIGDLAAAAGGYDTSDSSLSVSNNAQSATTKGNVVTNAITVAATNAETGAALSSLQTSGVDASVAASSTMTVSAPGGMDNSTLALDGNSNTADAVINTATNSVGVTEGNVASISNGVNASLKADDIATTLPTFVATADFVLFNQQTADGTADATATTTIVNQEYAAVISDADSVVNSSLSADGNDTLARAIANNSTNSISLGGNASFAATGGVLNRQDSSADVTATNTVTVGFGFDNDGLTPGAVPVDSSTVSVSGNTAETIARGNVATNSLNAGALALTAAPAAGGSGIALNQSAVETGASASYAVLNSQSNSGAVVGTATVNYTVALNGEGVSPTAYTLNASTVNVRNNVTLVTAAGNAASNTMTLAALNHGTATGVIGSEQVNSGDVTATVASYNAAAGFTANGALQSSTVAMSGNTVGATAVGNSSTSVLIRN